ncbi:hypothetical protein C943_01664 [Mariniradius saccharolyticus AK6]|uniref:Uncharacterized protein n=1 Tax=Mariniradius saccharolyticus AK6 TaxID=1239962 RepID=M7XAL4_9BACT|nr:hypothetical protein C943_01664 [Mariniradius saccharolyticus AK6]
MAFSKFPFSISASALFIKRVELPRFGLTCENAKSGLQNRIIDNKK